MVAPPSALEELGGPRGPHPGHGLDEGRVRVVAEDLGDASVAVGELAAADQSFGGDVADQVGGDGFARHDDVLALGVVDHKLAAAGDEQPQFGVGLRGAVEGRAV